MIIKELLSEDFKIYQAINGRWVSGSEIEIYKINDIYPNGNLVSSSLYVSNNIKGEISFYNLQDKNDKFVICVYFPKSYRILCNITNYGASSATINSIGIMYNTVEKYLNQTIHKSIDKRI